ncbi:MAG: YgiQ family radical SAM protein [Elusimicrobia bacterium]|nr:YgiQ family radical SAM protein [Elusimicrobiota bacterium]
MSQFLPMTAEGMRQKNWDYADIVLVSGDAYVDHPSFSAAIIGRMLERAGFRVAVLAQPDWKNISAWKIFGRPRLFFGITSGNVDSMINNYTANKKPRRDDEYSPAGLGGKRPDRAAVVYCQCARQAYPGVSIVLGGIESSMRRLAHYDYWSDTIKRSIILDSKADLLVYGMGEYAAVEIAQRLSRGEDIKKIRDMRGTAFAAGAGENYSNSGAIVIPSYGEIKSDKLKFLEATRAISQETNPHNAKTIIQMHEQRLVVQNPPSMPLSQDKLDVIYDLPFERRPHPSYKEKIPAFEMIKDSITTHRGCFGGCSFCSLSLHQGRIVQSRSEKSIESEIKKLCAQKNFGGIISDLGGPTANMYNMACGDGSALKKCKRQSCLYPSICKNLNADFAPLLKLLRMARSMPKIKKALISSGVRMDLALCSQEYIAELARHHTGGHLSVAPEHADPKVLALMHKPDISSFIKFGEIFAEQSRRAGKEQYLVPYFISGFPGSDLSSAVSLAIFLKKNNYRPRQINDFIPAPMELATAVYHTGIDPFTLGKIHIPKGEAERRMSRALLQYFKPENKGLIIKALRLANRPDGAILLDKRR